MPSVDSLEQKLVLVCLYKNTHLLTIENHEAHDHKGLTFEQIAQAMNKDEVWVAALFYGQVSSSPPIHIILRRRTVLSCTTCVVDTESIHLVNLHGERPKRTRANCAPSLTSSSSKTLDGDGRPNR
jgi:hypothetical protein